MIIEGSTLRIEREDLRRIGVEIGQVDSKFGGISSGISFARITILTRH
jgi:hypothetical protein